MENIHLLLSKLEALQAMNNKSTIDFDLMLDYTRKLYDALLVEKSQSTNSRIIEDSQQTNEQIESDINVIIDEPIETKFSDISNLSTTINEEILFNSATQHHSYTTLNQSDHTNVAAASKNEETIEDFSDEEIEFNAIQPNTTIDEIKETVHELSEKTTHVIDEITNDNLIERPTTNTGISIELPNNEVSIIHKIEVETDAEVPASSSITNEIAAQTDVATESQIIEQTPPQPSSAQGFIAPKHQKAKDIRSGIGINDQYLFLNELFNNNKASYDTAISKINNFENYVDAKEWVDDQVSFPLNWDKEDGTVQAFYALIEHHFKLK